MPLVLRHHPTLELNLAEYRGSITLADLKDFATLAAADPEVLKRDTLNVVQRGADFSTVPLADLDELFDHYRTLYAGLDFQLLRRSAWICWSKLAAAHVRHWLSGDIRHGMSSTVRLFETYEEAGDWLLLSKQEIELARRGDGFTTLFHIGEEPARGA